MKLELNKKRLKNLSRDSKALPLDMTPQVGGGCGSAGWDCRKPPKQISVGGGCITTYTAKDCGEPGEK